MNALNKIRNYTFWCIDAWKGGKVKKHYKEIKSTLLHPNSPESQEKRKVNLSTLLQHATSSTEYYKRFDDYESIKDFPVINKATIQDNFEAFKSEKYINSKKHKVSTSGSTGVPFFLFQDLNKRSRNTADVIFFSNQNGYKIGDKLYYLEAWKYQGKNSILSFLKNLAYVDVSNFESSHIAIYLNKLRKKNDRINIIGLASALENICKYLDVNQDSYSNNRISIESIIAVSEPLNDYTKKSLESYFMANVASRYSNEEMGILAQHLTKNEIFTVNWASYYFEILKLDSNEPADLGSLGRIVITDLFNYCMPLIRYDTGDIGLIEINSENTHTYDLKRIEGRKMDLLYDTSSKAVSPHLIHIMMQKYFNKIKQFQFVQKGKKDYTIKLNIHNEFPFESELINSFKIEFGNDANIEIEYVDEIPPLSSGKRRKVVNLYSVD